MYKCVPRDIHGDIGEFEEEMSSVLGASVAVLFAYSDTVLLCTVSSFFFFHLQLRNEKNG